MADAVRARGGEAETAALDVTEPGPLAARLSEFDARHPVDLLLANAGVSAGIAPDGTWEGAEAARGTIAANLLGAVNTVEPLLPAMRARGGGRIALMSSLAALRPLPAMPSYAASKAGLRAYGIALRGALRADGVSVTVICPGFVTTPMSARHHGPRPMEMPASRAAVRILRSIDQRRAFVSIPRAMAALAWADRLLPPALSDRLVEGLAARIAPEPGPEA